MSTTTEKQSIMDKVTDVAPDLLATWMEDGNTVLIDVREDFEHVEERLSGAVHIPLGKLDAEAIRSAHQGKRVVFHCRTGRRSHDAANRHRQGEEPVFHLAGGIEGWKSAGRSVIRPAGGPRLPVMRQVQIVAGSLVALGVGLGVLVSTWFLIIAGFVGCGLIFAGVSGWCGMAVLLAAMPWNRGAIRSGSAAKCCAT
jgi:rhodanese-related sulfurtransferase